ncbi:MAG: hypothetical protein RR346_08790 [Bacteroidales bacterium]
MKKSMMKWMLPFLAIGLWGSCSNEEKMENTEPKSAEINFSFNVADLPMTKNEGGGVISKEPCLDWKEIVALVQAGHLTASVSGTDVNGNSFSNVTLPVSLVGNQLITDPMTVTIDPDAQDCMVIDQITVTNTSTNEVIYSSLNANSPFAQWVDADCLMSKKICFTKDMIYKKTTIDLCVFCAYTREPGVFGYIKWNIDFTRLFCIPFSVNICEEKYGDITGVGMLYTQSGTMVNGVFTPDKKEYKPVPFPPKEGSLAYLCFADNLGTPDANEWYQFQMVIGNHVFTGVVNVADLLNYETSGIWDATNSYLHFWFCDDHDAWFFNPAIKKCQPNLKYSVLDTYMQTNTMFYHLVQPAGTWAAGLPTLQIPNGTITESLILTGAQFAVQFPVSFTFGEDKQGTYNTQISILVKSKEKPADIAVQFYNEAQVYAGAAKGIFVADATPEYYRCVITFPTSVEPREIPIGCYFLKFTPGSDIYLNSITIGTVYSISM